MVAIFIQPSYIRPRVAGRLEEAGLGVGLDGREGL